MNSFFRKMRCTVAIEMSKSEAAYLKISWGLSWNIGSSCSTVCSFVRVFHWPLWEIFALSMNRVCHCMIVLRAGGSFPIFVRTQRCVKRMLVPNFDFEVCVFFLVLLLNMEHKHKVEEAFYNLSKTQQKRQNISTMSIKSKERATTSNQTKQKN